jgi:protease IV
MDATKVAAAIRTAVRTKRVKAILLRIDSPGGSAVASETMYRETILARRHGKPVVASMGNVAGSGGYYIAAGADRIVAQPGTITGSIGVISGKPVVTEAKRKLGMTVDEVHAGDHALIASINHAFTDSEHQRFAKTLDTIYDDFVARVAEGRHMTREQVHEVARGRVWTGEDARGVGLVDSLGGFAEALRQVREVAGLPPDARLRLQPFPKKASPLAGLRAPRAQSTDDAPGAAWAPEIGLPLAAVVRLYRQVVGPAGRLHMGSEPEDWFIR